MVTAPSVKYHLPAPGEGEFRVGEYRHTTALLQAAWREGRDTPMPLEKDFSPTLAGDDRSREQEQILTWLERVPDLIRDAAEPPGITLGIKLMNARFDDAFQVEMIRRVIEAPLTPPDFLIYANRLFDPQKEFEGKVGVAYGGPELSERNLRCLELSRCSVFRFRSSESDRKRNTEHRYRSPPPATSSPGAPPRCTACAGRRAARCTPSSNFRTRSSPRARATRLRLSCTTFCFTRPVGWSRGCCTCGG